MKTSHKTWCQPISARKLTSKKMWLPKTELEISEISEFSILALYWNRKLRKLGNISNTCKFQGMYFTCGSWKFPRFPSFWFWPLYQGRPYLYWNRKLDKLGNIYNTCKFHECVLLEEVWDFLRFRVFDFGPYTEIENLKKYLQRLQIPRNVFYLRKLEISKVYEFSILALILRSKTRKTRKFCVKWICFIWGSYKFLRSEAATRSVL